MSISHSKNARWGIILSYASLSISLIGTLFVTNRVLNLIGDYNYGLYSFVNSITTWITVVSSALVASYLRFTSIEASKNAGDVSRTNTLYFKLLFIVGISAFVVGASVVGLLYGFHVEFGKYDWEDSKLIYLLFVFSILNIFISFIATIFTQFIHYKKQFVYEKLIVIGNTIITFIAHFFIAYFTKNIVYIAIYSAFSTLLTLCINIYFCKKHLGITFSKATFKENKTLVNSILVFSSFLVLNSVVDQVSQQVDKTLLGFFSTPENVTIYQLGMQFSMYLSTMAVAVSGVFVPRVYELYTNNKTEELNNLFLKVSRLQAIIVVFIVLGFVACGHDFILWWVGEKRIYAYYVGAVLLTLGIMPQSVKLAIEIQRAHNKHIFRSIVYFLAAIVNVLLSIILLVLLPKEYAIFACLIGTIVTNFACGWIATNIYNKKVIKLPMEKHWVELTKLLLFGASAVGVTFLIKLCVLTGVPSPLLRFLIEGFVFVFVYAIFLLIFERKFLMSILRK